MESEDSMSDGTKLMRVSVCPNAETSMSASQPVFAQVQGTGRSKQQNVNSSYAKIERVAWGSVHKLQSTAVLFWWFLFKLPYM